MRDNQDITMKFVKIVERYPEIYDSSVDSYRMRIALEKAWEQVAASVRSEIKEECTAEELKVKWKGIRSSFNRFKNKLYQGNYESNPCKKYYLYDSLRFLDPFTKPKGAQNNQSSHLDLTFDENGCFVDVDNNENSTEFIEGWAEHDIKPNIGQECDTGLNPSIIIKTKKSREDTVSSDSDKELCKASTSKRRKHDDKVKNYENEDMQFFKSILPDIQNFSTKEKRKLKMGILQLIDVIEDDRKLLKSNNEVSST